MKRTFRVHKICWDTDGINPRELNLPSRFDIDIDIPEDETDSEGDVVSDAITDKYGYCHKGFIYDNLTTRRGNAIMRA